MSANSVLAGEVLGHLEALGVRRHVLCAGARNVPLAAALLAAAERGEKRGPRVWHHFDERAAAFFALGMAKAGGGPAAVLTTSGTAAAELLPAAVEAHYAGVPLVLVTADRPARFRGSGAPQAVEQAGLFGPYAPVAVDVQEAVDLAGVLPWGGDGPLHINVCFEEPRPDDPLAVPQAVPLPSAPGGGREGEGSAEALEAFAADPTGLAVLLGELPESWRDPVREHLGKLRAPVWAESTSGLRESGDLAALLVRCEREFAALRPAKVLRIGGVPSLRYWRDLEERGEVDVLSVSRLPFPGLARASRVLVCREFPEAAGPARQGEVKDPDLPGAGRLEALLERHPRSEAGALRELSRRIPAEALVFLGNSLPLREWNLAAVPDPPHPRCCANRGANGIDGEVATFLGLSEGEEEAWGVFGDLTALCDLNAPALLGQLSAGRRRIVVVNNGGGRIFSRLPALAALGERARFAVENRHGLDFAAWAELWGMEYLGWRPGEDFPEPGAGAALIEIAVDAAADEEFQRERAAGAPPVPAA